MENKHKKQIILTWNPNWYHPFESPWGVFEKLMYANSATSRDILETLGTEQVKNNKSKVYGYVHRDLVQMTGIDEKSAINALGFNIVQNNQDILEKLIGMLHFRRFAPGRYIRKNVAVCPICMSKGFHSIFHQIKFISECPFHKELLIDKCPMCSESMLYEISNKGKQSAFVCSCGFSYMSILQNSNPLSHKVLLA